MADLYKGTEKMKMMDTYAYVSVLKDLVEQGREVSMTISGSSMTPFLIHERDVICFKSPDRELRRGDMVFYQRDNGQYVMHRIWKIKKDGYYIVGDAQRDIEGPVRRDQIFALIIKVKRKGRWIGPKDFWWKFFEHVWLQMLPWRHGIMWLYAKLMRK